jgi:hypothetical protein
MTSMRGVVAVPWTEEERAQLRRLHENGVSRKQMAAMLGRSTNSVQQQLRAMGLVSSNPAPIKPRAADKPHAPVAKRSPKTTLPPLLSLMER